MGCSNSRVDTEKRAKVVKVNKGLLEGFQLKTVDDYDCDVFLGVPYAKPPIGRLRFRKPQELDDFKEIRRCNKYPNRSIYQELIWKRYTRKSAISEDCLYLNIHAPKIEESRIYPVLFFIHGGAFVMGSAEDFDAENVCHRLVSRDIIVVNCHYRLGYLGFFSTADDRCPGNWGLWDMLAALKWTHSNIANFGGDPNNITLCGHSAGGVSADLISLSPCSAGLFQRKIVMGGNSYCHWAVQKMEDVKEYCREKALELDWKPEEQDLLEFFKDIPAENLALTSFPSEELSTQCHFPIAPVIDGDFFPDTIENLRLAQKPVPSIVGGGEYEVLLFYALFHLRGDSDELDNVINQLVRKTKMSKTRIVDILNEVYEMKDQKFYVNLTSDIFVNYSIFKYIEDHNKNSQCYAYSFDRHSRQFWGWLKYVIPFTGGTHGSDLMYLFDCNLMLSPFGMNKTDKLICAMTGEYFTNFIKFGDPNGVSLITWQVVDENLQVLSIKQIPEMKNVAHIERMRKLKTLL